MLSIMKRSSTASPTAPKRHKPSSASPRPSLLQSRPPEQASGICCQKYRRVSAELLAATLQAAAPRPLGPPGLLLPLLSDTLFLISLSCKVTPALVTNIPPLLTLSKFVNIQLTITY